METVQRRQFLQRLTAAATLAAIPLGGVMAKVVAGRDKPTKTASYPHSFGSFGKIERILVETDTDTYFPEGHIRFPFENRVTVECESGSCRWSAFNLDLDKPEWLDSTQIIRGIDDKKMLAIHNAEYSDADKCRELMNSLTIGDDKLFLDYIHFNKPADMLSSIDYGITFNHKSSDIEVQWTKTVDGKVTERKQRGEFDIG